MGFVEEVIGPGGGCCGRLGGRVDENVDVVDNDETVVEGSVDGVASISIASLRCDAR